jgi:Na+-driven multidrug efflux pump
MTMSLPIVVEDVVIAVSGMIVQSVVNVCGTAFVAGFSAVNKLYGALNIIASSLGAAVAAFSGQNYGAGNIRRVKKGNKDTMLVAVLSSLVISVGLFVFQRSIIGFFISDEETLAANAIDGAVFYLQRFAIFLWVLYAAAVLRATLQGIGYTKSIMVSGVVGFLARSIIAIFLPQRYGIYVLYYDEVSGWVSEAVILAAVYIIWLKNTKKRGEENGIKIT